MNCVLFAKMDQVFSLKNKNKTGKLEKDTGKVRESLSVRKSGNPEWPGTKNNAGRIARCISKSERGVRGRSWTSWVK